MTASQPISQINRPPERRDTLRRAIGSLGGAAAVRGFLRAVRGGNAADDLGHDQPKRAQAVIVFADAPAFRYSVVRLLHPSITYSELEA